MEKEGYFPFPATTIHQRDHYKMIAKSENGKERLGKLLEMMNSESLHHDQRGTFFFYFTWVLIGIAFVVLAAPDSATDFAVFGLKVTDRALLLALLAPVLGSTFYLLTSHNFLRNASVKEFGEIFELLNPEIENEAVQVVYRPTRFIKAERLMHRVMANPNDQISLVINTGRTLFAVLAALAFVLLWIWITLFLSFGFLNPIPYLSILATAAFARQSRLIWRASREYFSKPSKPAPTTNENNTPPK
jgi:hypothetical protein